MNRLERLINLLAALLDTDRPLSADDLSRRVPGYPADLKAFRRSFERDKETLREMGVPVAVEAIDPSNPASPLGYRIPKDVYYLRDPGLATDELAALHLAASAVSLEGGGGMEALWKLGGAVSTDTPDTPVAALPGATHLAALFSAISELRPVVFAYRGTVRHIDPWRLSFRSGHWYLTGRDHLHDEERCYRLDRIEGEVTAGSESGGFKPGPSTAGALQPWEMGVEELIVARLRIDAGQAGWAVGQLGDAAVEEWGEDGSVVLRAGVTNREAFRAFVLGFLDHAELLGPPELRADLVSWLDAVASPG